MRADNYVLLIIIYFCRGSQTANDRLTKFKLVDKVHLLVYQNILMHSAPTREDEIIAFGENYENYN